MSETKDKDLFNPCILVMLDDTKHGKVICGMSSYKNIESFADQRKLTKLEHGKFKDANNNFYKVIFNQH